MSQVNLHVKVIEGRDFPKMDTLGSVDAYVKISVGNEAVRKTKVINNTFTPTWNETFTFNNIPASTPMSFKVFDHDAVGSDDQISELNMNTNALILGKVSDTWYSCNPVKGNKKGGEIRLALHLCPLGATPFVDTPMAPVYPQQPMMGQPGMYPPGQPMMQPGMYPQGQPMMQPQPGMYPPGQPMMGQPGMYPQGQPMMQPGMYPPGQPMPQGYPAQPMMQPTQVVYMSKDEAKKMEKERKKEEKERKKMEKKVEKLGKKAIKILF